MTPPHSASTPILSDTDAIIELKNLSLKYPGSMAVERLSGTFKKSTMTAIIGPNGGGKSTLLKAIMGLVPVHAGKISFHNVDKKKVAYLPQLNKMDRSFPLSVFDLVSMGLTHTHGFFRKIKGNELVEEALDKVGLSNCAHRHIQALSGGQFQKVLFARLWLQQADVILLDEPFSGIDRHTTEDILELLSQWNQEGKSIISVLHHFDLVRSHFPEALLLARRLIDWGTTETVLVREKLDEAIEQSRYWESTYGDLSKSETNILAVDP